MTQLIDVEEKVREFEATKMNVKTINENGGHFIMVEVEDVRQGLAQILTQANTLHTQKVEEAVREDRERSVAWLETTMGKYGTLNIPHGTPRNRFIDHLRAPTPNTK